MVKYSREARNPAKAVKVQGRNIRAHFKNTFEVCGAIRGMGLDEAQRYLQAVVEKKRCVPFRRYHGGVGRTGQAKEFKATQGRWPEKSAKILLGLLRTAQSSAEYKSLNVRKLVLRHVQCNQAQRGRRRTYRAHGRINAYMSSPCHVEMVLEETPENVASTGKSKVSRRTMRKTALIRKA